MKPIAVPGSHGSHARDSQFKALFGLRPEQKWPAAGLNPITVPTGVKLWVDAVRPSSRQGKPRLKAMCPYCCGIFGGGRIQQHWEACRVRIDTQWEPA
jgi:hypothetical protein